MKEKILFKLSTYILVITMIFAFVEKKPSSKYKCLIQMTNYTGEGAYIVISLLNPQGDYEKTLYVHGDDNEWYYDITEWWNFYGKKDRILMQSQERPSVEENDLSQSLKLIRIKLIKVTEFGLKQLLKIKSITKMILSLN